MATKKKLIEINVKALEVLDKQAKLSKRSLKSYLEHLIENTAREMAEPSEEYKVMMDDMLERHKKGTLETIPYEEIRKKYGF